MGLGGWLGYRGLQTKLFRQNQFVVADDAETVFFIIVFDNDFILGSEQFITADPQPRL